MTENVVLSSNYREVLVKMNQASGTPENFRRLTLIAVSKGQTIEAIEALYHLGHRDFGENYAQELLRKAKAMIEEQYLEARWHFIGKLQTNKVKALIPHLASVHSVDSEKLARELAKQWKASKREGQLPIFLQVNLDEESTKSGFHEADAHKAAASIAKMPELSLQGLMCIPEPGVGADRTQDAFTRLHALELACRPHTQGKLSMGMSSDFSLAIQNGATHIRVGTALFGERPAKAAASAKKAPVRKRA